MYACKLVFGRLGCYRKIMLDKEMFEDKKDACD